MEMSELQQMPQAGALAPLREQIGRLTEAAEAKVRAGHLDLGPDLWLSTDPAGRGELSCQPSSEGFALRLEAGDSGAWSALGMRLPVAALKSARYLGLLIGLRSGDVFSFTPTLRYYHPEGLTDVPTAAPVILAGGPREHLSHIPLDPEQLDRATECELNLFFHTDSFVAEFSGIEPLLIL